MVAIGALQALAAGSPAGPSRRLTWALHAPLFVMSPAVGGRINSASARKQHAIENGLRQAMGRASRPADIGVDLTERCFSSS
jgi:hypothetical protein